MRGLARERVRGDVGDGVVLRHRQASHAQTHAATAGGGRGMACRLCARCLSAGIPARVLERDAAPGSVELRAVVDAKEDARGDVELVLGACPVEAGPRPADAG